MNRDKWETFAQIYLDFNIATACVLGILLLVAYVILMKLRKEQITLKKMLFGTLWSAYLVILLAGTILNRRIGLDYALYLTPFWSYKAAMEEGNEFLVWQIIYNVVMFMPWGVFLAIMWDKMKKPHWNIGSALLASVLIEATQFVLKCGTIEFDDVFHNVLGGITGYGIWLACYEFKKKKEA